MSNNTLTSTIDTVYKPIDCSTGTQDATHKKENLPAKFFKNMVSGYWLLLRLKEDALINEDTFNTALTDFIKPFDSVAQQNSLYLSFENDFKLLSKDLKKMIRDKHKPTKEKKTTKKVTNNIVKDNKDSDDIVSRIVDAALNSCEPDKPKRKYSRKKSVEPVMQPDTNTEIDTKLTEEENVDTAKPKRKYSRTKPVIGDSKEIDAVKPKIKNSKKKPVLAEEVLAEEVLVEKVLAEEVLVEKVLAEEVLAEKELTEEVLAEEVLAEKELEEGELEEEELEEEELEVELFTFNDGFVCLYDAKDLSLYDKDTHAPITERKLTRIMLPNNAGTMILDDKNNAYN